MTSQVLNGYLISDLRQLVLKYCWPKTRNVWDLCAYGNYEETSILEDENWNYGLSGACRGGHMEIVLLMIEKGVVDNWDWGLRGACEGGHMRVVLLMIEKGATDWNWGLNYACYGGHMDTVLLMIEKGATDWNRGVHCKH